MKALVISNRSELLPVYHRLKRHGVDAELVIWNSRFEDVWSGLARQAARRSDGSLTREQLEPAIAAAAAGEVAVLTATGKAAEWFGGAPRLFGPLAAATGESRDKLLFGGWFTGEEVMAPHLLVADWGAWPGGLGASVLGGLTLVRLGRRSGEVGRTATEALPSLIQPALEAVTEILKTSSFRGLFHFDVLENPGTGEMQLAGLEAGWPFLHTQAFLAELENLPGVLEGEAPCLNQRFVTVLPVTTPPWPSPRQGERRARVEVKGLTPTQQGRCFWFDIVAEPEERKLYTAGLDGFLCVATGAAEGSPALARARALELATRLEVPEKQYRPDAGLLVEPALATLEERWGVLLS